MKKKLLVIVLAIALCLCLAACGSLRPGGNYNGGMTDGNGTGTTAGQRTDAQDGTVENGNGQDGVIGGYTPMPSPRVTKNP